MYVCIYLYIYIWDSRMRGGGDWRGDTAEQRYNNHKIYIAAHLYVYICVYIRLGLTRIEARRSRGSTTIR